MIQDFKSLLSSAVEIRARLSVPPLRWVPGIGEEHVLRVAVAFLVCLRRWREREIRREGGREGGREGEEERGVANVCNNKVQECNYIFPTYTHRNGVW